MPTARSLTRGGITWGFTHDVTYGQYANGDYWVLGGALGGVEVSSISPDCVLGGPVSFTGQIAAPFVNTFQDRNGSMVNPHWRNIAEQYGITSSGTFIGAQYIKAQGYNCSGDVGNPDSYVRLGYLRSLNWAINNNAPLSNTNRKVLPVNTSLVSTDTTKSGNFTKIKKAAVLTCVSAIPADGSFRPPYSALDKTSYFTSADVDYSLLASVQASSVSSLMPSSTYVNRLVQATSGLNLMYQSYDFPMYSLASHDSHGGLAYGEYAGKIPSIAVGYINTNLVSDASKITIANQLIQQGIDLLGAIQRCEGSPIGYTNFIGGGGGQHQGIEMPLMFLGAILRLGSTSKELVKTWMNTIKSNKVFNSIRQFYEVASSHVVANRQDIIPYPSLYQFSTALVLQPSDIGSLQFKHGNGEDDGAIKLWSPVEFAAITGQSPTSVASTAFWNNYRQCCTAYIWAPFIFGIKAMGGEKNLGNDVLCRYYEMYQRRQSYGPYAEPSNGVYVFGSNDLTFYNNSVTPVSIGSIDTQGLTYLYSGTIKHSFLGGKTDGTVLAATPVSGIESLGISTDPNIYIEAPSSFRPGNNNVIKCYGVSGYTWPDLLVLVYGRADFWLDSPVKLFGANFYLGFAEGQIPFTSIANGIATVNVPVNPIAVGGENIVQVISVRAVNGQLEVKTTNAIKVKILP